VIDTAGDDKLSFVQPGKLARGPAPLGLELQVAQAGPTR
jgi:hypothetical protein